jgi:hypothetical protein
MSELRRNEMCLSKVFSRIDDAIERNSNIMFVCNFSLAEEISEYVLDTYDIIDKNSALYDDDIDEYYVGLYFTEGEIEFYCERARGISGQFKMTDAEGVIDYYIFLEMTDEEIEEKLLGEGSWGLYDLIWDEDDDEDCDSDEDKDDCEEDEDDCDDVVYDLIAGYADQIVENDLCPRCVLNVLVDLYCKAYRFGARDQRLMVIERLSKDVDD